MTGMFEEHRPSCAVSWCRSRSIDCRALLVLLVAWFGLIVYSITWLLRTRRAATRGVYGRFLKHESKWRCSDIACTLGTSQCVTGLQPTWGLSGCFQHCHTRCLRLRHCMWCCRRQPVSEDVKMPQELVVSQCEVAQARELVMDAEMAAELEEVT